MIIALQVIALVLILAPPFCAWYYAIPLPDDLVFYDYDYDDYSDAYYSVSPFEFNITYSAFQLLCYTLVLEKSHKHFLLGFLSILFLSFLYFFLLIRSIYPDMNYRFWGYVVLISIILTMLFFIMLPSIKRKFSTRQN